MKWPPLSHCAVNCGQYVDHICFSLAAPERELHLASFLSVGRPLLRQGEGGRSDGVTLRRGGGTLDQTEFTYLQNC